MHAANILLPHHQSNMADPRAKGKEPAAAAGILYYLVCCTEVHTKYI
jgi:hypothetical protein